MDRHFIDTCTIAVGPATGTVFPISSLGLKINALYDMGATKSCMSLKTFESLKLRLTKDRCPFVVTATGTSMEPIGFAECSFDINVVLLPCGCLSLNPFIEISIRNNSSSSDVLNIQASISISPKFESK